MNQPRWIPASGLLVLLAGCPYIFGPPEVPEDGDLPEDDSVNNSDDRPVEELTVSAHLVAAGVELRFAMTNPAPDAPTELIWSTGIQFTTVSVADLDAWNPETGEGAQVVPGPTDCEDPVWTQDYIVQVNAPSFRAVGEASIAVPTIATGTSAQSEPFQAGVVVAPALLCGTFSEFDNRHQSLLEHEPGGQWSITISDNAQMGDEAYMYLDQDEEIEAVVGGSSPNTAQVELETGADYRVDVWRDLPTEAFDFTVMFHE